jgi:hypothetical protein
VKNIQKKVKTLQALINGSRKIVDPGKKALILDEFEEISRSTSLKPERRRRLLNALHAARGLEGAILQVIGHHGIVLQKKNRSLGGYLIALANASPPILPALLQSKCQTEVVKMRNRVAHETGFYPLGNGDIDKAIRRVEDCLTMILR